MRLDVDLHRHILKLANGKALAMSVVDAGAREAKQAIGFVHGFGGRASCWNHQLENFQADYRVTAWDPLGNGGILK